MVQRSGAGSLDQRVTFQSRQTNDDGYGNQQPGPWQDRLTLSARLQPLFTSRLDVETVMHSRLQSQQPYNLIIRRCAAALDITTNWRAYDARTGLDGDGEPKRVFSIRTIVDPDERRQYLEMLVVEGEAT